MNFTQAFAALEAGKKINRPDMSNQSYIKMHPWSAVPTAFLHNASMDHHTIYNFTTNDIKSESWEIIQDIEDHLELLKKLAKVLGYDVISVQHGKLNCTKDGKKTFHWNPLTDDGDMFRVINEFPTSYYVYALKQGKLAMIESILKCSEPHE